MLLLRFQTFVGSFLRDDYIVFPCHAFKLTLILSQTASLLFPAITCLRSAYPWPVFQTSFSQAHHFKFSCGSSAPVRIQSVWRDGGNCKQTGFHFLMHTYGTIKQILNGSHKYNLRISRFLHFVHHPVF
jgi:hypothetical protein